MNRSRGVLIAGNWKMNHTIAETEAFFAAIKSQGAGGGFKASGLTAGVFPSFLSITRSQQLARELPLPVFVGAQNVHWEKKGAFTGEISAPMLAELGIQWALVGHSERRQYFGETDETVRKRAESLLAQGLRVILCVGETRAEREGGQTEAVLARQIAGGVPALGEHLIIAYEPVWAIGTGLTATPEQAQDAHAFIRRTLAERFGKAGAEKTQILYGGSVTPDNVKSLLAREDVDGALVGGASLKADSFLALVKAGAESLLS